MGRLFGTDGVRGIANAELTAELAYRLGRAGAYVLIDEKKSTADNNDRLTNNRPKIIIGMDTRISGDMLFSALAAGMCSIGAVVYNAGVTTTPSIAYLVKYYQLDAGCVITASHNPVDDNGIKFFNCDGHKLSDEIEDKIEAIISDMESGIDNLPRPTGVEIGYRVDSPQALFDYANFLKQTVDHMDLSGIKIALDCANGATSKTAPLVFGDLSADIKVIHNEPDGTNINKNCGSTHIELLCELVKAEGLDVGFAFDGDGDRLIAVDENGKAVGGDEIMSILANQYKQEGRLAKNTVVATVMSNLGFYTMGKEYGINIESTKVGDRYILENMLQNGYIIGGEQSGHIILLEYNQTGDGICVALQLAKYMKQTGKKFSELNSYMEIMPQVLINARVDNTKKDDYLTNEVISNAIHVIEQKFSGEGRVLIRPSGTEPLVRVMIEGKNAAEIEHEARTLADLIESVLG